MQNVVNINRESKDGDTYVVTDIHGDLDALTYLLREVGFDEKRDILIVVGDMIDRGDRSYDTAQYCRINPFVFPLEGNHEGLMRRALLRGGESYHVWLDEQNGGNWSQDYHNSVLLDVVSWFDSLPIAIELNIDAKYKIALMHASYPLDYNLSWEQLKDVLNKGEGAIVRRLKDHILWERRYERNDDNRSVSGLDAVVHGHTIQKEPRILGNRIYADTGGFINSDDHGLTLLRFVEGGTLMGLFDYYTIKRCPWTKGFFDVEWFESKKAPSS